MTRSDELMLYAVHMRTGLSVNGRMVSVEGNRVTVSLYDVPAVCVRFDLGDVQLYSSIQVSRKSAKVFNAILEAYTDCRVKSLGGVWLLERRKGEVVPIGKNLVTIPITRNDIKRNELESYVSR